MLRTGTQRAGANRAVVIRDTVTRWVLGCVIASLLVALVSPCFISSLAVYEWSPELEDYVFRAGYVQRKRDEGWATSHYGAYGFNSGAGLGDANASNVVIWGDSYVEAHQVNDEYKTASQVNQALSEQGLPRFRAVAVGHALWSVSDYYFRIPRYERLLHPTCHFIIVAEHGLKDLCPDGETFLSEPAFQFVYRPLVDPGRSKIIADLHEWGLGDLLLAPWKAVRTVAARRRNMRFSVGPCRTEKATTAGFGCGLWAAKSEPNSLVQSWSYALDMLKTRTSKPIVLVLVPEVPYLEHGVVCCTDPQSEWRARLVELCRAKHVGCIDMTETLVNDYQATGKLSRGFHNGRPGSGHLNVRGHWLLSRQICAYLNANSDSL